VRTALVETLLELAAADDRIFLVTGDLGWNVVEKFATAHPDRFLNAGVAEANMAGIATGLAQAGFVPFIYSIATFTSMRCYEQVRNGAVLHHLPVRVVGIGGGYAYGHAGPTHHALEDLAIARTQPGLTVLVPADPAQTRTIVHATMDLPGPAYLRVGKGGNAEVPGLGGRFALGRPEVVREGGDVLFLTCGSVVHEALAAARDLEADKVSAAVAVLAHLPFTASDALSALIRRFTSVITVEEGYVAGGLGSLVAETIAQQGLGTRLERRGVRESLTGASGSEAYMRRQCGLDASSLAAAARHCLAARG
jgi:transketolase